MSNNEKIEWLNRYKFARYKVLDLEYILKTEDDISALVLTDIRAESGHYSLDNVIIRNEEILEEYKAAYIEYTNIRREILNIIGDIKEPNIYRVIYLRYIALLDWASIAKRMGFSKAYIYKLHVRGLDILDISV